MWQTGQFDEVALYGSLIHVITQDVEGHRQEIRDWLERGGIAVHSVDWILPSLEDVFISRAAPEPSVY
ncbi:MAG: hypothetical protein RMK65_07970 [Anaerolineae bacterium]|nr:hypothetical protein [Anaerolineae bacterium]